MPKKKKLTGVDIALRLIALIIGSIILFGLSIWSLFLVGAGVIYLEYIYDKQK